MTVIAGDPIASSVTNDWNYVVRRPIIWTMQQSAVNQPREPVILPIWNRGPQTILICLEMTGMTFEVAPGEKYELVFENPEELFVGEGIQLDRDQITFWNYYPNELFDVSPDGSRQSICRL